MRIDKYLGTGGGYIRFANKFEINYNFRDWALPFGVQCYAAHTLFVQVLFITFCYKFR